MKAVRKLLTYTEPYKLFVILAPLLMALEVAMDLLQPLIMQKIIDNGIANNQTDYVIQMGLFMFIAAVIGLVGGVGCTIYSTCAAVSFATDIREDVFNKISYFSSENRDKFGSGKLITIITNDIAAVQNALMMTLRIFVRGPLLFIGSVIIVYFQARELFPILFVLIPILLFFIIFLSKKAGIWFQRVQEGMDRLNTRLQESIAGIRVVKAFVRKDYEINQFQKTNQSLTKTAMTAEQIITILMPILLFVINMGIIIALLFGVIRLTEGASQVGMILAFINYLNIILMALMSSSMVLMQLMRAFPSADRIQQVLETENKIINMKDDVVSTIENNTVEFKNVFFSYSKNGEYVLKDISFIARKGEKIGIIGPTGSGKTTLMKLLPRLYDVDEGEILIDEKNIKNIDVRALRSCQGYVTQKPFLFSGTIESNLKFGNEAATQIELKLASEHACATEFIEKFEENDQYILSQGATNLSGGQKQRLSIARAFIRKPKILILDDVTSAVDAVSEATILQALKVDYKDATAFVIASKISSIIDADNILVIDDGKIVSQGTHLELLKNCPLYREIYDTQRESGGVVIE